MSQQTYLEPGLTKCKAADVNVKKYTTLLIYWGDDILLMRLCIVVEINVEIKNLSAVN